MTKCTLVYNINFEPLCSWFVSLFLVHDCGNDLPELAKHKTKKHTLIGSRGKVGMFMCKAANTISMRECECEGMLSNLALCYDCCLCVRIIRRLAIKFFL
jgi:hypothetical protein